MRPRHIKELSITPGARFETGCIASFADGTSRHFVGVGKEATRSVASHCDERAVKVISISTPATIFRDLQGTRSALEDGDVTPVDGRSSPVMNKVNTPEEWMLTGIGRGDLLAERSGSRAGAAHDPDARR